MKRLLHLVALSAVITSTTGASATPVDVCVNAAEHGQTLRTEHKLRAARREFTQCAQTGCPAIVYADCARWVLELDDAIPKIVIGVRDGNGKDIPHAKATVDGEGSVVDGFAHEVDPGSHVLVVQAPGFTQRTTTLLAREGETLRRVDIRLEKIRGAAPSGERPRGRASWSTPLGLGLGGLALVSLGLGTASTVDALSYRSDLADRCGRAGTCPESDLDEARGKLLRSDVLLGVGLVAALASSYFLFVHPWPGREE